MIVGGQTETRVQLSSTIMSRLTRALAVYRTVIKHEGHWRTRGKCREHSSILKCSQISGVFHQCNARLRLLRLLYHMKVMWRKQYNTHFLCFIL